MKNIKIFRMEIFIVIFILVIMTSKNKIKDEICLKLIEQIIKEENERSFKNEADLEEYTRIKIKNFLRQEYKCLDKSICLDIKALYIIQIKNII